MQEIKNTSKLRLDFFLKDTSRFFIIYSDGSSFGHITKFFQILFI
jgi:hypothetical protein